MLAGLRQRALKLTNADGACTRLTQALIDHELSKEVALATAAATIGALIPARCQQGLEDPGCRYVQ
jgi:hypothetical protein